MREGERVERGVVLCVLDMEGAAQRKKKAHAQPNLAPPVSQRKPCSMKSLSTYLVRVSLRTVRATDVGSRRLLSRRRRHGRSYRSLSLTLALVVAIRCGCGRKVAHGRESRSVCAWSLLIARCLPVARLAAHVGQHDCVFSMPSSLLLRSVLSGGLWKELLEVLQKVGRSTKQGCDLRVDVLYGL